MKKKLGILLFVLFEFILFYAEKNFFGTIFSMDRYFILSLFNFFLFSHLIFNIKKLYDFIYHKRYLIAFILLLIITIRGYHGSSLSAWNSIIQPNINVKDGNLLIGIARLIRGDEYIVSTPMMLSQMYNNFSSISPVLMGKESLVTLFPSLPCFNISVLGNIFYIPYLILPFANAFAFCWYGKLFLIFFSTFELCMLITKKNRLYSLLGSMLIAFSPVCSWWSLMPILAYGPLAIILLNKFFKSKKIIGKMLYTIMFSIVGINYIMLLYPAWQVPFGYVYLCFVIWIIIENKKNLQLKQIIYLIISMTMMGLIVHSIIKGSYDIYLVTASTVYPGARLSNGGYGYINLFDYMINIFFPCIPFSNPCEYSNFISFYPVPLIIGIYVLINNIKNKINKKDILLMLLCCIGFFLSLWNYIEISNITSKITLLSYSVPERSSIVVGYICIFLLIRIMALYEKNEKPSKRKIITSFIISLVVAILTIILINNYFKEFITYYKIIIMFILFVPLITIILINNNKSNKYVVIFLIILSLFIGGTINPISKGIDVLTEKPFAKEIQKIVASDSNGKWLSVDKNYAISNYLVANGAPTINSTNYYPNLDLWYNIDKEKKYDDIYNRYAHILVTLTDGNTTFELVTTDTIKVYLNINDLNILDVNYIVSSSKQSISNKNISLLELYYEDGLYIYQVNYLN